MAAPFCRDCAYCLPADNPRDPYIDARCQNSAVAMVSPVSGRRELGFCTTARLSYGPCGPEAKFFESAVHIAGAEPVSLTHGA